jgi:TrmH family RNA methyltransferase
MRISVRNALFQEWLALKTNRSKRHRLGQFLVEGTSAIDAAVRHGWGIDALIFPSGRRLSDWARAHLASGVARRSVEMAPELLGELTERHEGTELLAVAVRRELGLTDLALREPWLVLVLDRPKSASNVGAIARSAVAFDVAALVLTGHAADPFDPACVRASVGTLFDLPLVRLPSQEPLLAWISERRREQRVTVIGTGDRGSEAVCDVDLSNNVVLVLGNETRGLSEAYRGACDAFARVPTSERQSSLNVAAAAAVVLYEARRQRLARASELERIGRAVAESGSPI